jgi:DNA-binding NarL/FixJ family response regulator
MPRYNFLVVDDHRLVCEGIAKLIGGLGYKNNKVFTAISSRQALEVIGGNHIDVALIDARIPDLSGIALAELIHKEHRHIKVIGMTSFDEEDTVADMLRAGVKGILLKRNTDTNEVHHCIEQVLSGGKYFTPEIQSKLSDNGYDLLKGRIRFTRRESEVLTLICKGQSTKQIAASLQLKSSTIEDYRKEMLSKTESKNTAELITFAIRNGHL